MVAVVKTCIVVVMLCQKMIDSDAVTGGWGWERGAAVYRKGAHVMSPNGAGFPSYYILMATSGTERRQEKPSKVNRIGGSSCKDALIK